MRFHLKVFVVAIRTVIRKSLKGVFRQFLENVDQKIVFFGARSPVKLSIFWRHRRLYKNDRFSQPKGKSQNSTKMGPLGSAEGRIS